MGYNISRQTEGMRPDNQIIIQREAEDDASRPSVNFTFIQSYIKIAGALPRLMNLPSYKYSDTLIQ